MSFLGRGPAAQPPNAPVNNERIELATAEYVNFALGSSPAIIVPLQAGHDHRRVQPSRLVRRY